MNRMSIAQKELVLIVKSEDRNFFAQHSYNHADIDYAFYAACHYDCATDYVFWLVSLGVKDFNRGCLAAAQRGNYDLLYSLLKRYGKKEQINILGDMRSHLGSMIEIWATHRKWLSLFELAISLIPNHSKKISQVDKIYSDYDLFTYADIYNMILSSLVNQKCSNDPILPEAITILAKRKFPIFRYNASLIRYKGWQEHFPHRLESQGNGLHARYQGIASNPVFLKNDGKKDNITQKMRRLYKDLSYSLNIPQSLSDKINNYQGYRILPDLNEFNFLATLESKPYLLNYFRHYFYYDKMKVYEHLNHTLMLDKDSEEDCVKI
jgi:hypothetical protein